MARTTRKEVESVFGIFVRAMNGHVATAYNDVGGYVLDYAGGYGGYRVGRVHNEAGGVDTPFGWTRRPAREMVDTLRFAIDALDTVKRDNG